MYQNVSYVHERRPFLDRSSKILQLPNVSFLISMSFFSMFDQFSPGSRQKLARKPRSCQKLSKIRFLILFWIECSKEKIATKNTCSGIIRLYQILVQEIKDKTMKQTYVQGWLGTTLGQTTEALNVFVQCIYHYMYVCRGTPKKS